MVFEQLNITLADHSGRAQDAYWKSGFHGRLLVESLTAILARHA
jgi:hypothetical protein